MYDKERRKGVVIAGRRCFL